MLRSRKYILGLILVGSPSWLQAASFTYAGGALGVDSWRQTSMDAARAFAEEGSESAGHGQLRLLRQSYVGYSPITAELLVDGGAYDKNDGFYDTTTNVSLDHKGPSSQWNLALQHRMGDDERGLFRRSLQEQFEGRFYSPRGKRHYQYIGAEVFHRWQNGGDWFSETYFLGQYLYRDLSTRDGLLQLKVGRMVTPVWAMGLGGKGFAQWWERSFTDSIGVFVFSEYEYFPEAKFTLMLGSGEARAQGKRRPSQLFGMSVEQQLLRGIIKTSYEKSQSAAAAGTGVNEEETTKLSWKYGLTLAQAFAVTGKITREKSLASAQEEKRQRALYGAAYFYRWGRALQIGKDLFENELALRYEMETWRQRGAGKAGRDSISASWSFLR